MLKPDNDNEELIISELQDALLEKSFSGDIKLTKADKIVAASDNSIYELLPKAVIFPKNDDDISKLLKTMNLSQFNSLSITAKGAGTGTNGQSLNFDIILDFSKYLNNIIFLDFKSQSVKVQAGVVLDQLNDYLKKYGYFFPVQISTSSRATIGGMLSTDASGKGSRIYGKTSDNILGIKFWNHLGKSFDWKTTTSKKFLAKTTDKWEKHTTKELLKIYKHNLHFFKSHLFELNRSFTGYNLPALFDKASQLNLSSLICGSEGTLGLVSEITLKIKPIPKRRALVVCFYDSFESALTGVEGMIGFEPLAVETMDEVSTKMAVNDSAWQQVSYLDDYLKPPVSCFNIIEFVSDNLADLERKVAYLKYFLIANKGKDGFPLGFYDTVCQTKISNIWKVRSRGVGLLGAMKGEKKPVAFVEDAAVPPQNLCVFISEFKALLDDENLTYGMYGHADVGCVHVRPALNLKLASDRLKIRKISDKLQKLVLKHKGIIWGEHGKGVRGEYLKDYLGDSLYLAMRQIKTLFDPFNRFNPGKLYLPLLANDKLYLIDSLPVKAKAEAQVDQSKYASLTGVLDCNGNGECFSVSRQDLMCPSLKISLDRVHSPKGRAMIIKHWLFELNKQKTVLNLDTHFGKNFISYFFKKSKRKKNDFNQEVFLALDGCLSCKACTSLCPVRVDIPEYKSKFLSYYYSIYRRPLRDFFVAFLEVLIPYIVRMSGLINFMQNSKVVQNLFFKRLGLISIPNLAKHQDIKELKTLGDDFLSIKTLSKLRPKAITKDFSAKNITSVIIVPDIFLYYYEPKVLKASIIFLKKLGYKVKLADFKASGKSQHVKGFIGSFTKTAHKHRDFVSRLYSLSEPVLTVEPSLAFTYRQEYLGYIDDLTTKVLLVEEFLAKQLDSPDSKISLFLKNFKQNNLAPNLCHMFGHCTQASADQNWYKNWQKIFDAFLVKLNVVKAGCCGMAGIFGHEKHHFAESQAIFEYSWQKPISQAILKNENVTATGFSCRHQVNRFTKAQVLHPFEFLLNVLSKN